MAVWVCFYFLLVSSHHLPAVQVPVELMKLPDPLLTVMMQARRLNIIPLMSAIIQKNTIDSIKPEMSENMKFASAVAETGMLLRDSEYKGSSRYESILSLLDSISDIKSDESKAEFAELVKKMADMPKSDK